MSRDIVPPRPAIDPPPDLWHLAKIGAAPQPNDGHGVRVGVIDSGVADRHPALPRVTFHDVFGTGPAHDPIGHGTKVCGLIAGLHCGVAPGASLVVVNALARGDGATDDADIERAFLILIAAGVDVINASMQNEAPSDVIHRACRAALARGILVVAAAGNRTTLDYPGGFREVLTVGETDQGDRVTPRSARGSLGAGAATYRKPDLCAPGEDVWTTTRDGDYGVGVGTSMAAAIVSGVAAVQIGRDPSLRRVPERLRQRLLSLVDPLDPATEPHVGGRGRIRVR